MKISNELLNTLLTGMMVEDDEDMLQAQLSEVKRLTHAMAAQCPNEESELAGIEYQTNILKGAMESPLLINFYAQAIRNWSDKSQYWLMAN